MALPLSVAIIASNEEKSIGRCLRSVNDLASEIIVVVNDCKDKTVEIVKAFNGKVYEETWYGFSHQKNLAIGYTSQPWILCLDADEEVDGELHDSIVSFIKANNHSYCGAYFARRTFFIDRWIKHGDWNPDYNLRLFRKKHGSWSNDRVHEKLNVSGPIRKLEGHLLHYSFENIEDFMKKNMKYAELFESKEEKSLFIILLRSCWKFIRGYFFKLGFLDGLPGFYIAHAQAFFTMYKHMRILIKNRTLRGNVS
ncbi:MAG: glycosyltransferase family 2 protein [Puniceicoccales bacterium]|jgi:glycosyltransferase involved in cell wall biosynthesis|nr:glycosyltransferase family 2 protein [Puniceicoccales bacterium]